MKTWKQIWENRIIEPIETGDNYDNLLVTLLKADGCDGGSGDSYITADAWLSYISLIKRELSIDASNSLFEVGCGCGAMLYPFYNTGHVVGGIDYSDVLIRQAKTVMPNAQLIQGEASEVDSIEYDFVISNGMFLYCPDYEYASLVMDKMYKKARKAIAILDVPDLSLKSTSEQIRRDACADYDKKYNGLAHLYYPQTWFLEFAEKKQCRKIAILRQNIACYGYNSLRFNCFIFK